MKPYRLLAIVFFSASSLLQAQTLGESGAAEMDRLLQSAVDEHVVPGVVAIVANKKQVLYIKAFGSADEQNRRPMQVDSIFRIASMTKPITSAAAMMLLEQGLLRLDDPVSKFLPAFANREVIATFDDKTAAFTTRKAAGPILIRHLLSHTSGFAYNFSNPIVNRLQQVSGKQLYELPLLYDPGSRWTYSNSSTVLGQVIEKITGSRLDSYFNEHIFQPLSMQDTFYAVPNNKRDRVVTLHQRTQNGLSETPNPDRITSAIVGEGGLFSVAADYIKFLQMMLNDGSWQGQTILKPESVQEMTRNQIGNLVVETQPAAIPDRTRPFPMGAGQDKFGFGFQITAANTDNPNLRSPGSYSWAGINNTHFWVDPKRQIVAVIMMQVLPFYDDGCMKVYRDFEAAIGRNLRP